MLNKFDYNKFIKELKSYGEEDYRIFSLKIINTNYKVIGVRTKYLEQIARKLKNINIDYFYNVVTFTYYEEVLILGFIIASIKDNDKRKAYFNKFIKKVDNWAICDMTINRFKLKEDILDDYLPYIKKLALDEHEFTCRSAYVFLLNYYVKDKYLDDIFYLIRTNTNNAYYVKMAISWLLSYTYLLDKSKTLNFIRNDVKDIFIYNKSIAKIRESLRVSREEKDYLKSLMKKKSKNL